MREAATFCGVTLPFSRIAYVLCTACMHMALTCFGLAGWRRPNLRCGLAEAAGGAGQHDVGGSGGRDDPRGQRVQPRLCDVRRVRGDQLRVVL